MEYSVIIPTCNRLSALRICLEAVFRQTIGGFEVIVVNDGSSDGTLEYLDGLAEPRPRVIHCQSSQGKSRARNSGIARATGKIVVFLDDDCRPEPVWLERLVKRFNDLTVGFAIGNVIYQQQGYRAHYPERIIENQDATWPMTANIAYRQGVLDAIGGFDPSFDQYINEDTELAIRAVARGFKYVSAEDAIVYHQAATWTVPSLWRSARNLSVWPILKKQYPRHYREFHPPILGGWVVSPTDYWYLLIWPLALLGAAIRYGSGGGGREWRLLPAKWPVYFVLRRFYLWREAARVNRPML
ncbi:MAG: glycosyltransferase family 2 protein [bacterium]